MNQLYIDYVDKSSTILSVPVESLIILFLYKYNQTENLKINFILNNTTGFNIHLNQLNNVASFYVNTDIPCKTPCIYVSKSKTWISGLCAVSRQLTANDLLGFKQACLKAPNQVSNWTRFCEIDLIVAIKSIFDCNSVNLDTLPVDVVRLEQHFEQPVRIHNIYKVANEPNTKKPKEQLNVAHTYVEGPYLTLADLILWPQIYLLFKKFNKELLIDQLPLIIQWYSKILVQIQQVLVLFDINETFEQLKSIKKPQVKAESLYKSDPKRYKPQNRLFTKQYLIDDAFLKIKQSNLNIKLFNEPFAGDYPINWELIALDDIVGALPKQRFERKCEQLKNLAKAVCKLVLTNSKKIVDFCSGSGHLGIILAQLLPNCTIVLLENKEESLERARERIEKLNLNNVHLIQSNLDYFNDSFDIGVSLHACGVATDLVIQMCMRWNATFVCCPCCYGGVHNLPPYLIYPLSDCFKQSMLTLKDYLVLGHSADQTHDEQNAKTKQGELCMSIIDTDRILYAQQNGYEVFFGLLKPPNCTPKNHLLVGIKN